MEKYLCITLVALMLTLTALVLGCVFGDCWRDTKMAELGYEQAVVPGCNQLVWKRTEAK